VIFVLSGSMLLQPAGLFPSRSGGDHRGSSFFAGDGADACASQLTSAISPWFTITPWPETHGTCQT